MFISVKILIGLAQHDVGPAALHGSTALSKLTFCCCLVWVRYELSKLSNSNTQNSIFLLAWWCCAIIIMLEFFILFNYRSGFDYIAIFKWLNFICCALYCRLPVSLSLCPLLQIGRHFSRSLSFNSNPTVSRPLSPPPSTTQNSKYAKWRESGRRELTWNECWSEFN